MLIGRFRAGDHEGYGRLDGDDVVFQSGRPFVDLADTGRRAKLSEVQLLAPLDSPRVFATGFNSRSHLKAVGKDLPPRPVMFVKASTSVIGPDAPIVYPRMSTIVHFEGEVAVVIGRTCRNASRDAALDFVGGYTCCNDVSERTIQREEMKSGALFLGKSLDSFCPLGPWIGTDKAPTSLRMKAYLNGELRQDAGPEDFVFGVAEIIAYLSAGMTLLPGDVILMGSPGGYGDIKPGDVVEIEIDGIGRLRNPVIAE